MYHQSVRQLDRDQARQDVRPDLGLSYLQRSSADDTSKQIVKVGVFLES